MKAATIDEWGQSTRSDTTMNMKSILLATALLLAVRD